MKSIPRREFLRIGGAIGAGVMLRVSGMSGADAPKSSSPSLLPSGDNSRLVPDAGWRMWRDVEAPWKDDRIFLPSDVKLAELPSRAPTGGWAALNHAGREVTLPATVEQFHWGETGFRPYKDEYRFETTDNQVGGRSKGACLDC